MTIISNICPLSSQKTESTTPYYEQVIKINIKKIFKCRVFTQWKLLLKTGILIQCISDISLKSSGLHTIFKESGERKRKREREGRESGRDGEREGGWGQRETVSTAAFTKKKKRFSN